MLILPFCNSGGRRLAAANIINKKEHLTVATKNEALSLLTGDLRNLSVDKLGPIDGKYLLLLLSLFRLYFSLTCILLNSLDSSSDQ